MASCGNQQFCTLCLEDDISNKAVTWCIDCETFLCTTCKRHHNKSKASKDHRIVSVEEYSNLPAFILNTSNRCVEHDKRYELFCRFHDSACCVQCINDQHKECRDLPLLTDILENVKSSAAMFHLEKDLTDIKKNFDEISRILSNKTITLKESKVKGIAEIHLIRKQINDHLDKLENQLLETLSTEYTKLKSDAEKLIAELEKRRKRIDYLHDDFVKMKHFATDLQTFVGSKIIDEMRTEESKYIESLRSSGELNTSCLEVNMSSSVNSIVNDVKCFGNISVRSTANIFELKSRKDFRKQMPITQVTDITHIKPKLKKAMKMPEKQQPSIISGCQILPDGQMLFADQGNRCLMLFSKDGEFFRDVKFESVPYDVCYISDNTVAVAFANEHEVKIVDVKKNKITKSYSTNDTCYGIECNQQSVMVATGYPSNNILSIDLEKKLVSKMITVNDISTCVTCFENKIYVAYIWKGSVACYHRNGKLLWLCKDKIINQPCSLSVDRNGFVYLSCENSHKVVVLTPDGKHCRVILSENDRLNYPRAINIDKNTSTLLVGNIDDGHAFLFQI